MRIIKSTLCALCIFSNSIAQNWDSLGQGVDWPVRSLYTDTVDHVLYVGGSFINGGGIGARGIASWDGTSWDTLGRGIENYPPIGSTSGYPLSMCRYNNQLHIGGDFHQAGTINAVGIAKWDGTSWYSISSGTNGIIAKIMRYGSDLYVCGEFDSIGGIVANGLAKWNGSTWSDVHSIPNYNAYLSGKNFIFSMIDFQGNLYVAGNFEGLGGHKEIVFWDGITWQTLLSGIYGSGAEVACMEVYQNELYVAGSFETADGNSDNYIQKWNGTTWSSVGGGVLGFGGGNGQIHSMKVIDGKLFVTGVFDTAGGVAASKIASWDGADWCGYGSTFNNTITAIESYQGQIYVGGGFTLIDSDTISRIAKWIGGSYVDSCSHINVGVQEADLSGDFSLSPNPVFSLLTIELSQEQNENAVIEIKNVLGQVVQSLQLAKGAKKVEVDVSGLSKGVYFVGIRGEGIVLSKKFIKQ